MRTLEFRRFNWGPGFNMLKYALHKVVGASSYVALLKDFAVLQKKPLRGKNYENQKCAEKLQNCAEITKLRKNYKTAYNNVLDPRYGHPIGNHPLI